MNAPHSGGRLVAWIGFVFGSVMSVAANVLHAWLPAKDMPASWHPDIAQQVGAAVWPLALLISVEVLSRVNWRTGFGWKLVRFAGAGVVAAASAVISYGHLHDVLVAWDYTWIGAVAGPLVLDGLMVVSGFALLAMSSQRSASDATVDQDDSATQERSDTQPPKTVAEAVSQRSFSAPESIGTSQPAETPARKYSDEEIYLELSMRTGELKRNDIMKEFNCGTGRAQRALDRLEVAANSHNGQVINPRDGT